MFLSCEKMFIFECISFLVQIQYEIDDGAPITYCQQVPAVVFEVQKQVSSEQGLLTLLDGILQNEKFSTKERTKHLKKVSTLF